MTRPQPGDQAQVGSRTGLWTVGEVVTRGRGYEVANLHRADGSTAIHIPLSEIHVVIPATTESETA